MAAAGGASRDLGEDAPEPRAPPGNLGTGKVGNSQLKFAERTLAFFPIVLQGTPIVVELRNQLFLRGTVYMADAHMNMFLSDVKATRERADAQHFPWMYVKSRTIRMLHLPRNLDYKEFVLQKRGQVAAMHAKRKVQMLSSTKVEATQAEDGKPEDF